MSEPQSLDPGNNPEDETMTSEPERQYEESDTTITAEFSILTICWYCRNPRNQKGYCATCGESEDESERTPTEHLPSDDAEFDPTQPGEWQPINLQIGDSDAEDTP